MKRPLSPAEHVNGFLALGAMLVPFVANVVLFDVFGLGTPDWAMSLAIDPSLLNYFYPTKVRIEYISFVNTISYRANLLYLYYYICLICAISLFIGNLASLYGRENPFAVFGGVGKFFVALISVGGIALGMYFVLVFHAPRVVYLEYTTPAFPLFDPGVETGQQYVDRLQELGELPAKVVRVPLVSVKEEDSGADRVVFWLLLVVFAMCLSIFIKLISMSIWHKLRKRSSG